MTAQSTAGSPVRIGSVRTRLMGWCLSWLVRVWTSTLRIRLHGPGADGADGPMLIAFRHGDQLPLLALRRRLGTLVAPVSLSADGELQSVILGHLGIVCVRGSSSRGGARAARGLLLALRDGASALVAVDGPRGPFGSVKPGVVFLARSTGAPIFPVAAACRAGRRLEKAWDRYLIPRPFTRTSVCVGPPIHLGPDADAPTACAALASALEAASMEAERAVTAQ